MAKHKYQPASSDPLVTESGSDDPVAVVEASTATGAAEVSTAEAATAVLEEPAEAPAPAPEPLPRFKVTLGDKSDVIDAANELEAWALFCDKHKHWPNPSKSGRTVELVK